MPKPYPREFRDDVVNVARGREPGQSLKQIAADFGIAESCLRNWMRDADVEDGLKPGTTAAESAELREARKRIRLLEQRLVERVRQEAREERQEARTTGPRRPRAT